ncbi:MAG TPA: YajQ family cyclic di-GMP-binding protein [Chthoniobacterales bacterium]
MLALSRALIFLLVFPGLTISSSGAVTALKKETAEFFPMTRDGTITIANTDGAIHIFGWNETRVRVATLRQAYSQARLAQLRVETRANTNALTAHTIIPPAHGFFADKSGTIEYTINVPETAHLILKETNGEISIDGLRGGDAEIDLVNGRVTARNCIGRVRARAKTGALEVISQWWENFPASFDYAIDYGTIRALLAPGSQFQIDALTTHGGIDDDAFKLQGMKDSDDGQSIVAATAPGAPVRLRFRDRGGNISLDIWHYDAPPTMARVAPNELQKPATNRNSLMPSFDIVSDVDKQEIDNALNQARKELATRFDFKGVTTGIEHEKEQIVLTADDASHLHGLREIVIGKLSKRGVDLRNIDQKDAAISSMGHARQELKIKQGLEGDKAKEIILAIKSGGFKVQNQLQDRQIRVTGKKRDELQEVIAFVKSKDFGVATNFTNYRD